MIGIPGGFHELALKRVGTEMNQSDEEEPLFLLILFVVQSRVGPALSTNTYLETVNM